MNLVSNANKNIFVWLLLYYKDGIEKSLKVQLGPIRQKGYNIFFIKCEHGYYYSACTECTSKTFLVFF